MRPLKILAFILATLTVAGPWSALADVTGVTLYPDSARVEERETVPVERADGAASVRLLLPLNASPDSLTAAVNAPGLAVTSLSVELARARDTAEIEELRRLVDNARRQRDAASALVGSLEAQAAYWKGVSPTEVMHPQEIGELARAMGVSLASLLEQRGEAGRRLEERDKELAELEEKLERAAGEERDAWEARIGLAGDVPEKVEVDFSYMLGGSGWSPSYRVEATPEKGVVAVSFQAEVRQGSGRDWTSAPMRLATLPPVVRLDPPGLPEWIVRPRPEERPMPRAMLMESAKAPVNDAPMLMAKAAPEQPVESSRGSYRVWDLGPRDLPAGQARKIDITRYDLAADFSHLLRPAVSEASWLRARVEPKQSLDLPAGPALYLVDGEILARGGFSFQGLEGEIYFGSDPLVTAEVETLARASGEKGFINEKRTQQWKWAITVKNAKPYPVKVRVEEPEPQPRDERIAIETNFDPKPAVEEQRYVWSLQVPASSQSKITWGATLKAPSDMELDLGWR